MSCHPINVNHRREAIATRVLSALCANGYLTEFMHERGVDGESAQDMLVESAVLITDKLMTQLAVTPLKNVRQATSTTQAAG